MRFKIKSLIALLPLIITAFSPMDESSIETNNFYSLRFLKDSGPPRNLKMVRLDNSSRKTAIQNGVLVTYKNIDAGQVRIAGDFSDWKPENMERGKSGVWYFFITDFSTFQKIRYKFIVDDIWIKDPKNYNQEDDGMGSYVSIINPFRSANDRHISYRVIDNALIEFNIYKPGARLISLVGDFNNWNPENDLMQKGKDGIWRIKKKLNRGTFRYKFIVDGKWLPDLYNRDSASDDSGSVCSVIKVK